MKRSKSRATRLAILLSALALVALAAPAGSLPHALGTAQSAACNMNVYKVIWAYAGVYQDNPDRDHVRQVGTLRRGDRLTGYHGGARISSRPGLGLVTHVYYGP